MVHSTFVSNDLQMHRRTDLLFHLQQAVRSKNSAGVTASACRGTVRSKRIVAGWPVGKVIASEASRSRSPCLLRPRGRKRSRCQHQFLRQCWPLNSRKVQCPFSSSNQTPVSFSRSTADTLDRNFQYKIDCNNTLWPATHEHCVRVENGNCATTINVTRDTCAMWMGQHVFSQT